MKNFKINSTNAPAFVKQLSVISYLSGGLYPYPFDIVNRLRELEKRANNICTKDCNGTINSDLATKQLEKIKAEVLKLLPVLPESLLIVNGDPRGYTLKLKESFAKKIGIYTDWGGYGILSPEF